MVVEDGTGKSDADSYISAENAGAYHMARGNSAWLDIEDIEACLIRATDYMVQVYRSLWQGSRVSSTQALDWPRNYVYLEPVATIVPIGLFEYSNMVPADTVPVPVQRACAELALRAGAGSLLSDLTQGVLKETVGPISVEYDRASSQRVRYVSIDSLLAPYLKMSSGVMVNMVRA